MAEKSLAEIYKEIVCVIKKTNETHFLELQEKGEVSSDLKADYQEFCNTLREVFEENPETFSLDKVYVKIPRNAWVPICHNHLCLVCS